MIGRENREFKECCTFRLGRVQPRDHYGMILKWTRHPSINHLIRVRFCCKDQLRNVKVWKWLNTKVPNMWNSINGRETNNLSRGIFSVLAKNHITNTKTELLNSHDAQPWPLELIFLIWNFDFGTKLFCSYAQSNRKRGKTFNETVFPCRRSQ